MYMVVYVTGIKLLAKSTTFNYTIWLGTLSYFIPKHVITAHQEENSDQLRNPEREWDCTFIQKIYYHYSVKNAIKG